MATQTKHVESVLEQLDVARRERILLVACVREDSNLVMKLRRLGTRPILVTRAAAYGHYKPVTFYRHCVGLPFIEYPGSVKYLAKLVATQTDA